MDDYGLPKVAGNWIELPKVSIDDLKAFGLAVKRERSLRVWTLDQLGAEIEPPVGKSLISKIEKGRKESLNSRTVGRFIKALDLDANWIDKFLDTDETDDGEETKAERDADRIIARATREEVTEGASEDLLIHLANTYAEGKHRDIETAYVGLLTALEAAERIRKRGEMPPENTGSQLNAVLAEVAKLNAEGDFDEADALFDAENRRMQDFHKSERDRMDQQIIDLLERRLDQDRLRNRPDLAANRLIEDLRQKAPPGGLFWAINAKALEWREQGRVAGDIFALRVGLALAKANYERSKSKKTLAAAALHALGWCHFRLAEVSTNDRHLIIARTALETAVKKTSKAKDPLNWASHQTGLGVVLTTMGKRAADPDLLRLSVRAHREALETAVAQKSENAADYWNNLGNALLKLGEITRDATPLREAVQAQQTALTLSDQKADPVDRQVTQSNLALAQRWLGDVTENLAMLDTARQGYAACEALDFRKDAPFQWAMLQWNIADLALARFRLTPDPTLLTQARALVGDARAFFVDGSDYQTQQCDELLEQIEQAEALA